MKEPSPRQLTNNIKWVERFLERKKLKEKKEMQDLATSIIRTIVPFFVGAVVTWLISLGVEVPQELTAQLTGFLTFIIGALYYVGVRALAKKYPKLEWLLGVPVKPTYK